MANGTRWTTNGMMGAMRNKKSSEGHLMVEKNVGNRLIVGIIYRDICF